MSSERREYWVSNVCNVKGLFVFLHDMGLRVKSLGVRQRRGRVRQGEAAGRGAGLTLAKMNDEGLRMPKIQ